MVEWLQKALKNVAEAKLLPDADMPFLINMENVILEQAKKPVTQMREQGLLPPSPATVTDNPPFAMPSAAPGAPSRGGVMGSPAMPGGDELRRILQPAAGPQ